MKIAVIVPIRNEEGNIARLLGAFASSPLDPSSVFLIEGNSIDLAQMDDQDPKKDRLLLNEVRIEGLIASLFFGLIEG